MSRFSHTVALRLHDRVLRPRACVALDVGGSASRPSSEDQEIRIHALLRDFREAQAQLAPEHRLHPTVSDGQLRQQFEHSAQELLDSPVGSTTWLLHLQPTAETDTPVGSVRSRTCRLDPGVLTRWDGVTPVTVAFQTVTGAPAAASLDLRIMQALWDVQSVLSLLCSLAHDAAHCTSTDPHMAGVRTAVHTALSYRVGSIRDTRKQRLAESGVRPRVQLSSSAWVEVSVKAKSSVSEVKFKKDGSLHQSQNIGVGKIPSRSIDHRKWSGDVHAYDPAYWNTILESLSVWSFSHRMPHSWSDCWYFSQISWSSVQPC